MDLVVNPLYVLTFRQLEFLDMRKLVTWIMFQRRWSKVNWQNYQNIISHLIAINYNTNILCVIIFLQLLGKNNWNPKMKILFSWNPLDRQLHFFLPWSRFTLKMLLLLIFAFTQPWNIPTDITTTTKNTLHLHLIFKEAFLVTFTLFWKLDTIFRFPKYLWSFSKTLEKHK